MSSRLSRRAYPFSQTQRLRRHPRVICLFKVSGALILLPLMSEGRPLAQLRRSLDSSRFKVVNERSSKLRIAPAVEILRASLAVPAPPVRRPYRPLSDSDPFEITDMQCSGSCFHEVLSCAAPTYLVATNGCCAQCCLYFACSNEVCCSSLP